MTARLNSLIKTLVHDELHVVGHFQPHNVLTKLFKSDLTEEEKLELAEKGAIVLIKSAATRGTMAASRSSQEQADLLFPELREAYVVDTETILIKRTEHLNRMEFLTIIEIREQSVAADQRHLDTLKEAYAALKPYWEGNPDLNYEQVERLYQQARQPIEEPADLLKIFA